jgi:uncharacterized phage protein gp47/JayE
VAGISASLDVSDTSLLGILNAIVADREGYLWSNTQEIYAAMDPDANTGQAQDAICAITGTLRDPARRSLVTCLCNLDAGTTLPAGSVASVTGNPSARFRSIADYVSPSSGNHAVDFESEATGPIVANAGTLIVIATPLTGWNSVTNAADASLGAAVESDTALRIKREEELAIAGAATVDAIRAALLALAGVELASVYENTTDVVDPVTGLPPRAFEALIYEPVHLSNDLIAQTIWKEKGAGVPSYGNTSGLATDSEGVQHRVYFSRPALVDVYLDITIGVDPDYPGGGDALVKAAVALYGATHYKPGSAVYPTALYVPIFTIPGVLEVTTFKLGTAPAPSGTTPLAMSLRQLPRLDTARISITS